MKRLTLSLLSCGLLITAAALVGCGGKDDPTPAPAEVIDRAFADVSSSSPVVGRTGAEVEVTSLGYQDAPLKTRTLRIDPATYATIREAIAGPPRKGEREQGGLRPLIADLSSEGTESLEGTEVEHVSGRLDIAGLIENISNSIEAGNVDTGNSDVPGLGDLADLEDTLTEATIDLYATTQDGSFERLDLTLSLDDRDNASPATRIRFSLTETDPEKASS